MKFPFVLNLSPSLLYMVTVHTADFETNSAFSEGCNIVLMCDYFFLLLILVTYIFILMVLIEQWLLKWFNYLSGDKVCPLMENIWMHLFLPHCIILLSVGKTFQIW